MKTYSFDDSLDTINDELGDFFITKAELNKKWTKLREDWESLVNPYAVPSFAQDPDWQYGRILGPNRPGRTPPDFLLRSYLAWREVHSNYLRSFAHDPIFSFSGAWMEELKKQQYNYINTYNKVFPGTPSSPGTPEEQSNATSPVDIARDIKQNTETENPPEKPEKSFMQMLKDDIGTYALVIGGGILAYNVFFRLAEGGFFRAKPRSDRSKGGGI